MQTPVTPGHEFCGEVVAGSRPGFSIGDNVTAEQVVACGQCLYCQRDMRWLCAPHDVFGFHTNVNGGLAEYMIFPARAIVYKLPNSLPPGHQVYIEPLSCAVHGVERADIQLNDVVVIAGCGPIGLGMVATAKRRGPSRIVAVDCLEDRLGIARECGADVTLQVGKDDIVKTVQEMTGGYGCDVYMEASGNPASVKQGLAACRKGATFVEFSVFKDETTVDWTIIGDTKELTIKGGHCSGRKGYEVAIDMLESGILPIDRIVSHSLSLTDIVDGINLVKDGSHSVKVTIDPTL